MPTGTYSIEGEKCEMDHNTHHMSLIHSFVTFIVPHFINL